MTRCVFSRLPRLNFLQNTGSVGRRETKLYREIANLLSSLFISILSIAKTYLMSLHSQMCSLSYKGYARGVDGTPDEWMMVSAIMNVLALRFSEGNKFHAFCTHFPKEGEVKNLAQVRN